MKFGDVLKKLRTENGLSQYELSEKLNISKSSISMYENGNRQPDYITLEMIADLLNVEVPYLMGKSTDQIWTEEELVKIKEYKEFLLFLREK